jgi:hypothetical protein
VDTDIARPTGNTLIDLALRPVSPMFPVLAATKDKPLGEFTMTELLTWGAVGFYLVALELLVLRVTARVAVNMLRGPAIRR